MKQIYKNKSGLLKFFLLVFVLFSIIGFLVYGKLILTYFQQDEWLIYGTYIYWMKAPLSWFERLFVYEHYTHLIPFSDIFSYLEFRIFGLNFIYYALIGIILHITNSLLVCYLTYLILKNKFAGLLAGLLFLTNSISRQTIIWIATTMGTAGSQFFLLISMILYIKYLELSNRKFILFIFSLITFFISVGFKETSLFIVFFYIIFWFMYRNRSIVSFKKEILLLTIGFVIYILFRIIVLQLAPQVAVSASLEIAKPPIGALFYRVFTDPLKIFVQSIIPTSFIIKASQTLISIGYPQFAPQGTPNPYIVESVSADVINYSLGLGLLSGLGYLVRYLKLKKDYKIANALILSLIFIFFSTLPLVLIPGKAGYFSLVDGRYIYLPYIFISLMATSIIFVIRNKYKKNTFILTMLIIFIGVWSVYNIITIRGDINKQVGTGFIRRSILSSIYRYKPKLDNKIVFYITSDQSYYGLPDTEKIVPFQSGFGQTLLVWYDAQGENFPSCFFKDEFLYPLLSEGYKECEGRGFGYYRNLNTLKASLKINELTKENVIGLSYTSYNNTLTDITDIIKKEL